MSDGKAIKPAASTIKNGAKASSTAQRVEAVKLDSESQMTCSVLCSLSQSSMPEPQETSALSESSFDEKKRSVTKSVCPKQLQ